jgi:hypothetical protein
MIFYLLRFSLSLALFYFFYKILLEKENSFQFNRIILLGGILVSTLIPTISLEYSSSFKSVFVYIPAYIPTTYDFWENVVLCIYGIVAIFLGIRLLLDIFSFIHKINQNKSITIGSSQIILVAEDIEPHAFLKYIFINEKSYESLPKEMLDHEIAHVSQLHTYDIFVMEILKVIFWFNPIIKFYKKAIQQNHEFLADQYVLKTYKDQIQYQKLLLSYLEKQSINSLSSHFNFSFIQKRLKMMETQSPTSFTFKKLMIIPLMVMIMVCCTDNKGVSGKEMLEYWRYTASLEEILTTGELNKYDLENGIILPIENKEQFNRIMNIYKRMNHNQKKSVYKLPSYMEPVK